MDAPRLPPSVDAVVGRLLAAGLRVFLVGGAPRDALLGRPMRDCDLLVEAHCTADPAAALELAASTLPEARRIGKHLPVVALAARGRRPRIEVSAARPGARTLEADLRLRDFTLNAIAFEPSSGRWIDPLGGRTDLAARRLRVVDARTGFVDDPVRVARGARLAAELALEIDADTRRAMARHSWRLARAAGERLGDELTRVLRLTDPTPALLALQDCGALAVMLPELLRCAGVGGPPGAPDLFTHSLSLAARLRPDPLLRLAALLHAAAAAETRRYLAGGDRFVFIHTERRAARYVARAAQRLRWSRRATSGIQRRIRHATTLARLPSEDTVLRRMLRRVGRDILEDVLELHRADLELRTASLRACGADARHLEAALRGHDELARRVRRIASDESDERGSPAISGKEIMNELGIAEGPEVHRWLMRVQRRVWERPADNTPERLLQWLREARSSEAE